LGAPGSSPDPGYYETSEYMIGSIAVGVFLLESDGSVDPSTEDWSPEEEAQVHDEIEAALSWWASQNPGARVSFTVDYHYDVEVSYEPINRPSGQESLWISEAMSGLGYSYGSHLTRVRNYLNDLRELKGTDWAFAVFVVDSSNDPDGCFTDEKPDGSGKMFAYAYIGGPFLVMTYDNDGWGIDRMNRVCAHEIGHIFYATDEYDDTVEYSGYLNVPDTPHSGCLMDTASLCLSSGTRGQIGWRDSDGDGIPDIVDTHPETDLVAQEPDPTTETTLTYHGSVTENPYPNHNPKGSGRDVSINRIMGTEYRVDSGVWIPAEADDGAFNELREGFHFTISGLALGSHTVEVRSRNWAGNVDISSASDEVTILSYEFTVTLWPSNVSVQQGGNASLLAYVELEGSMTENTILKLDGLPTEVGGYEASPPSGKPPFSSNISILIAEDGQSGGYTLRLRAESQHVEAFSNSVQLLVLDKTPPSSSVQELQPNILNTTFTVSWHGADNAGGSGIKCFDVQYKEGQGEWKDWLTGTNLTSSDFTGRMPEFYRFRCRAWDWQGNCEEYPDGEGDTGTVLGYSMVIHTPYSVSQALIRGVWYSADEDGDLEIPLLPGSYAVEVESVIDLGPGERAVFEAWGDGNSSNPLYVELTSNVELDTEFHEEYELLLHSLTGHPEGSGWYPSGSNASISVEGEVLYGNGTKDLFSSWTGDWDIPEGNSSVLMDRPHFFEALWAREYLLEVKSRYGDPSGEGWYAEGSMAYFSVRTPVDQANLTRRVLQEWSGDVAQRRATGMIIMDGPKTVVARWGTEYYLQVRSRYGDPTGQGWYPAGEVAHFSLDTIDDLGNETRMIFVSWSGDVETEGQEGNLTMLSPHLVTALWRRQYLLQVWSRWGEPAKGGWTDDGGDVTVSVHTPVDLGNGTRMLFSSWTGDLYSENSTFRILVTGPIHLFARWERAYLVEVDEPYNLSAGSGWYLVGDEAEISLPEVIDCGNGTRRVFVGWSDPLLPKDHQVTLLVRAPFVVSPIWKTQYLLAVETAYGVATGGGWYDGGSVASFGVEQALIVTNGTRYVFVSWTGDSHSEWPHEEITMSGPKTLVASWRTEHYLELDSRYGHPRGEGWYVEGNISEISVEELIELTNDTRRVCEGWRLGGALLKPSVALRIQGPTRLSAVWRTEHYLRLTSPWGDPQGGGWHPVGAAVSIAIQRVLGWGNGTRLVFESWRGGAEEAQAPNTTVLIDGPKNLTASWRREHLTELEFLDHEGRAFEPDSALLLGPRNRSLIVGCGGAWLEEGIWSVSSVMTRGWDVAPREGTMKVGSPSTWRILCELYRLEFDVKDILGFPVSKALVHLVLVSGERMTAVTGADGRCSFSDVPKGRYVAEVSALGFKRELSGNSERAQGPVPVGMELSRHSLVALVAVAALVLSIARFWPRRAKAGRSDSPR